MEPPWWPDREIREDPRFQASKTASGYLDYGAELSVEEARKMHERFRPRATTGVYEYSGWQEIIQPMLRDLDLVFGPRAHEFSHFHVGVFEWESGLD